MKNQSVESNVWRHYHQINTTLYQAAVANIEIKLRHTGNLDMPEVYRLRYTITNLD